MTQSTPTRVLIVDDHPMVAEGICALLESFEDIEIVGTLTNGEDAVDQAKGLNPDVILLDLNMPKMGGLTATEILLEQSPKMRILILTMHDSPEYISAALSHGAMGYVLKDVPTEQLKDAIDAVMRGETYLCEGARQAIGTKTQDGRVPLTEREQTVLLEVVQGKSNKVVAQNLDISVRTVETHRKNIKRKLGISSTAGLTRYAIEHGVLQDTARF
ncbi:LuxR family two component transcriptional regulator [Pacificibacter maritimus]|uniref:LuxR family two component transcriptional regulator n=1 Tax=Pacificibacter maritimus TaxID=762213 RepID=A0A3N4VD62_9RHOB|nr:response regulator transcription factor [Pacificibacter maritimus]RPE71790.1 LuxR family two component transcriptional regulator [Pacificibacter maritimus]